MSQDSQQSQSEQELQFKKRARRRLVGAIGLVLLMITILPLLLKDKTEQAASKDILISIPSQDAQLNNQSIEEKHNQENSDRLASTQPQDAAASNPSSNDKHLEETKSAVLTTVESAAPVAQSDKETAKPIEAQAVSENQKNQKQKEDTKPQTIDASNKADELAPIATPVVEIYFVQIGIFSDPENVKQMQSKLSTKGLKSSIELIDTANGKKTRLRVGSFTSRKDADKALVKVKTLGMAGMVIGN